MVTGLYASFDSYGIFFGGDGLKNGTGFSLWGFVVASPKTDRLKPVLLEVWNIFRRLADAALIAGMRRCQPVPDPYGDDLFGVVYGGISPVGLRT